MIHLLRYTGLADVSLCPMLSASMQGKMGQEMHPLIKTQSLLSGLLLDRALHYEYGLFLKDLEVIKKPGGKPRFAKRPDLHFSMTHCEGLVACAFGSRELGIDAEKIRPFNMDTAKRVCTGREILCIQKDANPSRLFFLYWVLKESYCKAIGMGLLFPMREVEFWLEPDGVECNLAGCKFNYYEDARGYLIALCRLTGA